MVRTLKPAMPPYPLRLHPGDDLRLALETHVRSDSPTRSTASAFVIAGIGSLHDARIRYAGAHEPVTVAGPLEIISLSGSLSADGAHLHVSVSDAQGRVVGGHLCAGSLVRTTAEVLIADLPQWHLTREPDAATGYPELVVRPLGPDPDAHSS